MPPYNGFQGKQKALEPFGSRDESMIRGTTLLAPHGAASGSIKPYPGNGGNRVPLLKAAFVYGTDSGTRPARPPHRLAPSAGSLEHRNREDFSFFVFEMYTSDI